MKVIYFDCFSGISGDMVLGALLDLGLPLDNLKESLKLLNLDEMEIKVSREERNHIFGTRVEIISLNNKLELRNLFKIKEVLEKSGLSLEIKNQGIKIFENLTQAEAKIHQVSVDQIHFHEIGAVDTIVDIVGTLIGIAFFKVEKILCSYINTGTGFVEYSHGKLPIPAPATLELLKNIPIYSSGIRTELTTPTGAAIISTLTNQFGHLPLMKLKKIGYGVGTKRLENNQPNLLRLILGELKEEFEQDEIEVLETNIDNLSPEIYDYLFELLFQKGINDVFITPVLMKKTRPASMLTILVEPSKKEEILSLLFKETSTLGIRSYKVKRQKLKREIKNVDTPFGMIKIKISGSKEKIYHISPEYEDCKRIAQEQKLSLKETQEKIKAYLTQQNWPEW